MSNDSQVQRSKIILYIAGKARARNKVQVASFFQLWDSEWCSIGRFPEQDSSTESNPMTTPVSQK